MTTPLHRIGWPIILLVVVYLLAVAEAQAQRESSCTVGRPNAPIRLDVYSDYESPRQPCVFSPNHAHPFHRLYGDWQGLRDLSRVSPQEPPPLAVEAARYSQAAMRLGQRQWLRMAEAIFQAQSQWGSQDEGTSDGSLKQIVATALNSEERETLQRYLDDGSVGDAVSKDILFGLDQEVRSTPTLILRVGGKTKTVEGALRYSALKSRLNALRGE